MNLDRGCRVVSYRQHASLQPPGEASGERALHRVRRDQRPGQHRPGVGTSSRRGRSSPLSTTMAFRASQAFTSSLIPIANRRGPFLLESDGHTWRQPGMRGKLEMSIPLHYISRQEPSDLP